MLSAIVLSIINLCFALQITLYVFASICCNNVLLENKILYPTPNNYIFDEATYLASASSINRFVLLVFIPICNSNIVLAYSFDLLCQYKCNFIELQEIQLCSKQPFCHCKIFTL